MNTQKNSRYRETEQRIREAFVELLNQKDANRISVSDICQKGHLSRSAFYAHYEDINELIYRLESEKSKRIKEVLVVSDDGLHDKLEKYFAYLMENRRFYQAYFTMESNASLVTELMRSYEGTVLPKEPDAAATHYYMHFLKAGIREIAAEWLKHDCKESPADMAELLTKGLPQFLLRK